jgi:pilus assembly protein CpaF
MDRLSRLLARDDIADIMVNGTDTDLHRSQRQGSEDVVRFRDNQPASERLPAHRQPGRSPRRRVEPDLRRAPARRQRVNVIAPPLSIDGAALTIRKFKKDKLTLDQLVKFRLDQRPRARRSSRSSAGCAATWSSRAAPGPARRRCSTA